MNRFNSSQSVGEIVSIMPQASEIFKKYKIDFCCGGNRQLSAVLSDLSLNEDNLLRVHGMNHEELFKVHKLFSLLKADLEQHLLKEGL